MKVVSQFNDSFPSLPRYTISNDLWEKLDETNKAAMILHEVVYKEGIESDHQNSLKSRYFHELIAADQVAQYARTEKEYSEFLRDKIEFQLIYKAGIALMNSIGQSPGLPDLSFYSDGSINLALRPLRDQEFSYGKYQLKLRKLIYPTAAIVSSVSFWPGPNGTIKDSYTTQILGPNPLFIGFKKILEPGWSNTLHFSKKNELSKIGGHAIIRVQDQEFTVFSIEYDSERRLVGISRLYSDNNVSLKKLDGSFVTMEPGATKILWLNEEDLVVDSY